MTHWTTSDIPDQHGRVHIVTGANGGLGAAITRALYDAGAHVILACRNAAKAEAFARELGPRAQARPLDLADLSSIRAFAESIEAVDVLINNAGVMAVPFGRTADGFETQFGTNYLGHYALTGLLLDRLRDRVVSMSSHTHFIGDLDVDDLDWQHRGYVRYGAYAQSKLANLLFTYEFQRRLTESGSPLLSVAGHPGFADTDLTRGGSILRFITVPLHYVTTALPMLNPGQTAEMGALPLLYAATAAVEPGTYYGPDGLLGLRGYPTRARSSPASHNRELAQRLWEQSEKLTDVRYHFSH
ncbi:SDR family NAD(P)-dependent oxidoreductase [Nocardia uniformis]|uniref:SDR family NAD(P)-dependent oxidoreductase n=1 Tax=Nocardia uniformis TaxID=53432 RepID=A0A849C736_9NOCA|nr:oxidoreductase [Nocardia uniformis]NNH68791.1 SDR family NAD(P)-dependent oxidoreductase [Nocardia uniformis]